MCSIIPEKKRPLTNRKKNDDDYDGMFVKKNFFVNNSYNYINKNYN